MRGTSNALRPVHTFDIAAVSGESDDVEWAATWDRGFGGRLWADEAFRSTHTAIGGYASYTPTNQGLRTFQYGAQLDYFPVRSPLGASIEPFVSLAGGRFHTAQQSTRFSADGSTRDLHLARWSASPGGGIRLPLPDRLQLRFDLRDVMVFNAREAFIPGTRERTMHLVQFTGAFGVTF